MLAGIVLTFFVWNCVIIKLLIVCHINLDFLHLLP